MGATLAFLSSKWLATPGGLPGLRRPVGVGLGPSNGTLPSAMQNQAVVGPQPNSMMQHYPLGYDSYPEVSYGGTRLRDVYTHVPGGPPVAGSRDSYLGYSGHSTRNPPSPSHGPSTPNMAGTSSLGYPPEHNMGAIPSGGHQLVANLPYFGHANAGPPPTFPPSSSHGSGLKGVSNGRRSPPSPPHLPNGMPSSKSKFDLVEPGTFQIGE